MRNKHGKKLFRAKNRAVSMVCGFFNMFSVHKNVQFRNTLLNGNAK